MMSADSHWLSLHLLPPMGAESFPVLLFNQLPLSKVDSHCFVFSSNYLQTHSDTLGLLLSHLAPLNGGL